MSQSEQLRNSIIDKLLSINNLELLAAFNKILESSSDDLVKLNSPQKELLMMSQNDIEAGRIVSQEELDKEDSKWVN